LKKNVHTPPPPPYLALAVEEEALLWGGEPLGLLNRKRTSIPTPLTLHWQLKRKFFCRLVNLVAFSIER
jgi:hypothetical protein